MQSRQVMSLSQLCNALLGITAMAMFCPAPLSATEPPPKSGLLGYELHTPLTVEGYCPYEPRKDVYETLIVEKVNGKTLDKHVKILIENLNVFLPAKTPLVLKGYENAEDSKGVTIKDWRIVAVNYWGIFFHLTEVVSPPKTK